MTVWALDGVRDLLRAGEFELVAPRSFSNPCRATDRPDRPRRYSATYDAEKPAPVATVWAFRSMGEPVFPARRHQIGMEFWAGTGRILGFSYSPTGYKGSSSLAVDSNTPIAGDKARRRRFERT